MQEIHNIKFTSKPFHKRNTFLFYTNCMLYLGGNIPSKTFYPSVDLEISCIVKTPAGLIDMVTHVNLLLMQMKKQGSGCVHIISLLKRIFHKHLIKWFISFNILLMNLLGSPLYNSFT